MMENKELSDKQNLIEELKILYKSMPWQFLIFFCIIIIISFDYIIFHKLAVSSYILFWITLPLPSITSP